MRKVRHAQLTKALNSSGEVAHPEIESTLRGLGELNSVVREFQRRDWTEDQIRRMEYTEVALLELRRRTVEEQVMSKTIQAEAQNILLDQAHADLELLKSRQASMAGMT